MKSLIDITRQFLTEGIESAKEKITPEQIKDFASKAHEAWRKTVKPGPRMRSKGGEPEIDINQPFEKLTPEWKEENLLAAPSAFEAVYAFPDSLHDAAAYVHKAWMDRNPKKRGDKYSEAQHVAYDALSKEDQKRDQDHIHIMREVLKMTPLKEGIFDRFKSKPKNKGETPEKELIEDTENDKFLKVLETELLKSKLTREYFDIQDYTGIRFRFKGKLLFTVSPRSGDIVAYPNGKTKGIKVPPTQEGHQWMLDNVFGPAGVEFDHYAETMAYPLWKHLPSKKLTLGESVEYNADTLNTIAKIITHIELGNGDLHKHASLLSGFEITDLSDIKNKLDTLLIELEKVKRKVKKQIA